MPSGLVATKLKFSGKTKNVINFTRKVVYEDATKSPTYGKWKAGIVAGHDGIHQFETIRADMDPSKQHSCLPTPRSGVHVGSTRDKERE